MISINNLSFSYTNEPFIKDMNLQVNQGEIFGFLGPSGSGKSTLQKILIGLLPSYTGSVKVDNIEVKKHNNSFYENIGVDFEFPNFYEKLTARENLKFFGSLYSKHLTPINELLEMVELQRDGDKKVSEFSKGMKSRLNFIKSLIHNPDILFLDEPTSGLDPSNAKVMKNIILKKKSEGKTIIITTHNMYDATEVCDRVAFIVNGSIKTVDSPHNLIMSKSASKVKYSYIKDNVEVSNEVLLSEIGSDKLLQSLISENKLLSIHSLEPTLNDIFVDITGRTLQ